MVTNGAASQTADLVGASGDAQIEPEVAPFGRHMVQAILFDPERRAADPALKAAI
jgi:hypothetical protein